MPPIRTLSVAKPIKTERTHEENQERAYIAASRRSDRSLEARIESARRASDIHKKRTGRALRVTEQDVINEEMYEEEDDDLPAQYQRLSAHLQSNSLLFNRKLHDYITTQTAVRSSFMQQQLMQQYPYSQQFNSQPAQFSQGMNPFMGHQMGPPSAFNQTSQNMNQSSPSFPPQAFQQSPTGYRQNPYPMPQRPQPHQRSASIATPQQYPGYQSAEQVSNGSSEAHRAEEHRRMSLPPNIDTGFTKHGVEGQARPGLSRSSTAQSIKQQPHSPTQLSPHNLSPHTQSPNRHTSVSGSPRSAHDTPQSLSESAASLAYPVMPMDQFQQQVINLNPLSMSLPPESQQFVGNALDPNDPNTAIFMAGSDNLPQPWRGTYRYNPNISPKSSRAWNAPSTMPTSLPDSTPTGKLATMDAPGGNVVSTEPHHAASNEHSSPSDLFNPASFDVAGSMNLYGNDFAQEEYDESAFFNFAD